MMRQLQRIATLWLLCLLAGLAKAQDVTATWDFNDGCWLKAPSGFVHEDNTEKPAYSALEKLIHGTWESHEALMTDTEGFVTFTGFKGDYTIHSDKGNASFNLTGTLDDQIYLSR